MDRRASEITAVISPRASCLLAVLGLAITVFIPFAAVSQTTLNAGDPVTNAVRDGDVQAVRNLVVRNAKLNVADVDGRTPLVNRRAIGGFNRSSQPVQFDWPASTGPELRQEFSIRGSCGAVY